jgi:hypothetical protein
MANPQLELEINSASQAVQRLQNELAIAQARESEIYREQRQVNAELRAIKAKIQDPSVTEAAKDQLTERGVELEGQYNRLERQGLEQNQKVQALQAEVRAAESELRSLQQTAAQQEAPKVSAGETAAEANQARDDAAQTQAPPTAPVQAGADGRIQTQTDAQPTNAQAAPTQESADRDLARAEQAEQTRAESAQAATGAVPVLPGSNTPVPSKPTAIEIDGSGGGAPTAQAPSDDNTPAASNATQAAVAQRFQQRIEPRPNILDQYASYTYSLSMYLMSSADYSRILREKKKVLGDSLLLMQSGGAPTTLRNQYFKEDFYIDNLQLKTFVQGKGTRSSFINTELSFRITEPYGITLFQRLYRAVQSYIGQGGGDPGTAFNYSAQHYLMVIRFYGYDDQGNMVSAQRRDPAGTTDRDAITEKWIPFRFTGIKFRIDNRLTEYECSAVSPQNDLNTGRSRGVLPFGVQVQGGTLGELLSGPVPAEADAATPPPPPSSAERSPKTVTTNLQESLNRIQAALSKPTPNAPFDYPDRYFFRIVDPVLRDALVRPPGRADISRTAQPNPTTPGQARDGRQQSVDPNSKYVSGYPGQSIVQFLDLAIRSSTYIMDQQRQLETVDGKKVDNPGPGVLAWYHIGLESRPREYDESRGDYAYDFTYVISLYRVSEIISDYFPQGRFNGVHKRYDYWFTGANTQILDFDQEFNYLYLITTNVAQPGAAPLAPQNYQEIVKRAFAAQSGESKQQGASNTAEGAANAADFLYSPADQARNRMTIVGDPDWIQQGSLWGGALNASVTDPQYVNWLSDGSINFDTQEVLYELGWNTPGDYDLDTGVMVIKGQR